MSEGKLLVRDDFNDDGNIPSPTVAPTASPDVICYQMEALSPVDAAEQYEKNLSKPFQQGFPNNIYIRAKNIGDKTLAGKVKAFYAPLNLLYQPPQWIPIKNLTQKETELELVDYTYVGSKGSYEGIPVNGVGINREAFVLDAVSDPKIHHCMMGLCTDPNGHFLQLPSSFNGNAGLWSFLRNHREIAYHNMIIVQPFAHTVTLPVSIGSHDEKMRRFVMDVEVTKGVETLKNATLLMQSTDAACRFNFQFAMDGRNPQYGCEAKIPAEYSGFMNFSVIMQDYAHVDAILHVKNYAVDTTADEMTPDVNLRLLSDSTEEKGTLLGDFQLFLGAKYSEAPKAPARRVLSMPTLMVHQQM